MAKKLTMTSRNYDISSLVEEFLAEKKALGLSPKTISSYKESFHKIFSNDSNLNSNDMTAAFVREVYKKLDGEALTYCSINHHLRALRAFLRWGEENNFLTDAPKVKMIRGQEPIKETYTVEELYKLLEKPTSYTDFLEWRNWAIVNWIVGTGNRASTVVSIKMKDIDLRSRDITITTQKNKKATILPMDEELHNVIAEYIKRCRSSAKEDEYLFPNIYGDKLTTNGLYQAISQYNHSRGVLRSSIHAFRHTFAKLYIMNGGELVRLQKLLGHSSLDMSRHYVNLFSSDLKIDYNDVSPLAQLSRTRPEKKHRLTKKQDKVS